MTWNRHHKTPEAEVIAEEKAPEVKKEIEKAPVVKKVEKKPEVKKEIVTVPEVVAEEKAPEKPAKKPRTDTKIFNNVGIVGDTVEVRDFRAIIKKAGKQINTELTKMLKIYNNKNYNL